MEELENALSSYFDKVTHAGFALMFGFYAVGPLFITWFLPAAYANAIPVLNVISFAVVPYLIYAMSRSIIHGIDHRPIHLLIDGLTILTLTCSFFFLRWMYPFKPFAMITLSFLAACVMAGAGSYLYILQRVHVEMNMKWLACHGFLILLLILSSTQWLIVSIALFLLLELVVLVRIFRGEFSAVERQR